MSSDESSSSIEFQECILKCEDAKQFYTFPTKAVMRNVWLYKLGLEDDVFYPKPSVCDRHFSDKMFDSNKKLKAIAVPDMNLPTDVTTSKKVSKPVVKTFLSIPPILQKAPKRDLRKKPTKIVEISSVELKTSSKNTNLPKSTATTDTQPIVPIENPSSTQSWINDSSNILVDYQLKVRGKHLCDVIEIPEYIVVFTVLKAKQTNVIKLSDIQNNTITPKRSGLKNLPQPTAFITIDDEIDDTQEILPESAPTTKILPKPAEVVQPPLPVAQTNPLKRIKPSLPVAQTNPLKMAKPSLTAVETKSIKMQKPPLTAVKTKSVKVLKPPLPAVQTSPLEMVQPELPAIQTTSLEIVPQILPKVQTNPPKLVQPVLTALETKSIKLLPPPLPPVQLNPLKMVQPELPAVQTTSLEIVPQILPAEQNSPLKMLQPELPAAQTKPLEIVQPKLPAVIPPPIKPQPKPEMDIVYYTPEEYPPKRDRAIQTDLSNKRRETGIQCDVQLDNDIREMSYNAELYWVQSRFKMMNPQINMDECLICGEILSTYASKVKHAHGHEASSALCSQCGDIFDSQIKLKIHEKTFHSNNLNSSKLQRCPKMRCNKAFRSNEKLINHIEKEHTKARQYKCNKCLQFFSSSMKLSCHQRALDKCLRTRGWTSKRWSKRI